MNCQNLIQNKKITTSPKGITILCTLFFLFLLFSFPSQLFAALPDCATVSGTAKPGNNCLFFGQKLCTIPPSIDYTISPSEIIAETPQHRVNCSNLSDLPLCGDIDGGANPGKNCVKECSDSSFDGGDGTRGQDYAVHNRDCIRFCDAPESGVSANPAVNCTSRKCHQSSSPNPSSNCDLLPCNLLTTDELNDDKFVTNETNQYCDGSTIKCYEFARSQLPYVYYRQVNPMCTIHGCKPTSSTCGSDDTINITQKYPNADPTLNDPSNQDNIDYTNDYVKYISANIPLENNFLCTPVICKPVIKRQMRCLEFADENPTTRNEGCDPGGDGAVCNGGYCYKTIDCNLSENKDEAECMTSDVSNEGPPQGDPLNSWFYRPRPNSKSEDNGIIINMSDDLCYTEGQMEGHNWGNHPKIDFGALGVLDLGYHHDYLGMSTRSPGLCGYSRTSLGSRGMQYLYMCGVDGIVYRTASDETAYYVGYAYTSYGEQSGNHQVTVCYRFNNAMIPGRTCGERECGITCAFSCGGIGGSHVCGREVCRTLTLNDENPKECEMSDYLTHNDPNKGCMSTVDNVVRMRAVKYGNHICTFFDTNFHLAYDPMFFNRDTKILTSVPDGPFCASGTLSLDENGNEYCAGGKNTNEEPGLAHIWRTLKEVAYIQNNQPNGKPRGYLTKEGVLSPEQECPKVIERISTHRLYNLANFRNSLKLFTPPLYILNARTKRGGNISNPIKSSDPFGPTDFNFPEIEVRYGSTTKKLSLGIGKDGYEIDNKDPLASATISTTVNENEYVIDALVRKEYNSVSRTPIFCLYRKIQDENGIDLDPVRVQCVERKLPDIDNAAERVLDPTLEPKKVVIYPDANNQYNNSKIVIRYLAGFGANGVDNNCQSDDLCTSELKLDNEEVEYKTCDKSSEKYEICVQREACSKLNIECIQNEINIHQARVEGTSVDSFLAYRKQCNELILPSCNEKKGIFTDPSASILNPNPEGSDGNPNAYGWFNDLCVVSGFEKKLKYVFAYDLSDGVRGKCIVSSLSPYLTDSDPNTNCDDGGKAPNCLCSEAGEDDSPPSGQEVRKETPREAGLCIDMPKPSTCPAITYVLTPNSDTGDPYYVAHSLNKTAYDDSTGVNISHKYRTEGKPEPDPITQKGHAEFPMSIMGMSDIIGECNGFWKSKTNVFGVAIPPTIDCLAVSGDGVWGNVEDSCTRYTCPGHLTSGPNVDGNYQGGYGAAESGENKGTSNGFATWDSYTKTNDFLETAGATQCIYGFKPKDSLATTSSGTVTGSTLETASFYGLITGYTGGSLPTRQCNQLGQWLAPTDICERLSCPADIPPTPTGTTDPAWARWENSSGATFPSVNASRSNVRIQSESVSTGTCEEDLGFFQAPGGNPPTRECDYLGNWGAVINPCVTHCDAVTGSAANNFNNGFAYWNAVTNVPIGGEVNGTFTGCISGFKPYPYPSLKNKYGTSYTLTAGAADYTTTIPEDVTLDTRSAGNPERVCESVVTAGGNSNVWTVTSSVCIEGCPGASEDPRIGVGKTVHPTSTGNITLEWPTTSFGQTVYITNPGSTYTGSLNLLTQQDATHYADNRNNGYYIVARTCGSDGKWQNPIPHCATKGGTISTSNATFTSPQHSTALGSNTTGSCLPGFYKDDKDTATISYYQCSYEDANQNIDQVYFNKVGGKDCRRYCSLTNSQLFDGNAIYTGASPTNNLADFGNQTLSCRSNHGSQVIGGSRTNAFANCGRSPSDRNPNGPYATCQANGNWSTTYNPCYECRGCNSGSTEYIEGEEITHGYKCLSEGFSAQCLYNRVKNNCGSKLSISNNSTVKVGQQYGGSCYHFPDWADYDMCLVAQVRCKDGAFFYDGNASHNGGCNSSDNNNCGGGCSQLW